MHVVTNPSSIVDIVHFLPHQKKLDDRGRTFSTQLGRQMIT
jgi:hypothetical protein